MRPIVSIAISTPVISVAIDMVLRQKIAIRRQMIRHELTGFRGQIGQYRH